MAVIGYLFIDHSRFEDTDVTDITRNRSRTLQGQHAQRHSTDFANQNGLSIETNKMKTNNAIIFFRFSHFHMFPSVSMCFPYRFPSFP